MALREFWRALGVAGSAVGLVALSITAPSIALLADPASALGATPAVTVPEASVLSSPYTVELAPGGELRILSFPDALVSSVVVAKPWLVTVLVQGHDVVLQAKATSGETQVIVYEAGAGTLWNIVIAPHKAMASRIIVSASTEEPAGGSTAPQQQAGTPPTSSASARIAPGLSTFVASLNPDQRAGYDTWQRQPTMEHLSNFLAMLDTTQRGEFEKLVAAGNVTVPQSIAAPSVVETTTVLQASPAMPARGQPQTPASAAPVQSGTPGTQDAPVADASSLYAYPTDVPQGITVTAQVEQGGDSMVVRYTIHNSLRMWLQDGGVSATDGHGAAVTLKNDGPHAVAPGADASGTMMVAASTLPVTLHWTWAETAAQRASLFGIARQVSQGTAEFYIQVTH